MPRIFLEKHYSNKEADIGTLLKEAFIRVHEEMIDYCNKTNEFDCALSGSTATMAVIDNVRNKCWVGHVGDSRSIICLHDNDK